MGKFKTLCNLLKNDRATVYTALVSNLAKSPVSHLIPDRMFLKMQYRSALHKKLDLKNPKTFNEKLQWLKLYNRNPEYCRFVDKYEVKNYIGGVLGEEYVIPTYGVWDKFEDIDFDKLPDRFVLKCTHDSGSVVVCRDKANFDVEAAREKLTAKRNSNLFWHGREWPYKSVKPRIIAEEYLEESERGELKDYKLWCFDGEVKYIMICSDRFSETGMKQNFYTTDWELSNIKRGSNGNTDYPIEKPKYLDKMIEYAKMLSKGMPFIRVDFYEVEDRLLFGELTFFPASGFVAFVPDEWDTTFGNWIKLPEKK